MSHNLLKILTVASIVGIPIFLFKDQILSIGKTFFANTSDSTTYASPELGASGGISTGANSELF